jgi:2-(1,2-epoxy-1,2-dihydrophenyl)acetyl-CoA isomerase
MSDAVLVNVAEQIATITFNRPAVMNAMNLELILTLKDTTEALARDVNVRAVVVRGAGGNFMAGGDVSVFHKHLDELPALIVKEAREFHYSILNMRRMPKPVLAVVEGACAGAGVSFMAAADLAIAADNAKFTLAYSKLGASPDGGASYFLPRVVGQRRALQLAMLPDVFDANTAFDLGLVNWVVPAAELNERAQAIAKRLADGPTIAFAKTKMLINQSLDMSLESQLEAEAQTFAECARTADIREGVTAFVEKRKPKFSGR